MRDWKYVPSTVAIGPHGPMVTRGYMEIGGLRIYDSQLVVGPRGEPMISEGYTEIVDAKTNLSEWKATP